MGTKSKKWTYAERLAASQGKITGLTKRHSPRAIARRLQKNEGAKLAQVMEIRRLWRQGATLREIEDIYKFNCQHIIENLDYFDAAYNPKDRPRKR